MNKTLQQPLDQFDDKLIIYMTENGIINFR